MTETKARNAKQPCEPLRLLHVVPAIGIGGVEIAAHCAAERLGGNLQVQSLSPSPVSPDEASPEPWMSYGRAGNPLDIRNAFSAVRTAREFNPDVIIFSLWKTILAFLLMRLLLRDRKFVLFVHSDRSAHMVERLATSVMARLSHAVWADSASTLEGRLGQRRQQMRTRVISFILYKPPAVVREKPKPVFAYWGRLNKVKRVKDAIDLFHRIASKRPDSRFIIIGPDSGTRQELEDQVHALGLDGRVEFAGSMRMPEIAAATTHASFFVQLSKQEGVAMSVIEAMQLGLVPVVTPVGEIRDYCKDGVNSIIFSEMESAAESIDALLDDADRFRRISSSAISQWKDAPLYDADLITAARELCAA